MESIQNVVKKERWFKIGKWKEPVFLQDIIVRAFLEQKNSGALPYYPKSYLVTGFKQFMRASEYKVLKKKVQKTLERNHRHVAYQIKKEVLRAINHIDLFNPKSLSLTDIRHYIALVKVHSKQSLRFIIMGYVLEKMFPEVLPKKFALGGKQFTPQSLLALTALPKKMMPMVAENISLLTIAQKMKEGKPVTRHVTNHTKKFCWMNSICWWDEPFTEAHYHHEAKQLVGYGPKKQLAQIVVERKHQYQTASAILRELKKKFPLAWQYIDIIREMADMREESWDAVSRAGVRLRPRFKILAAKHYISYNQLMMLSVNEMLALMNGSLPINVRELHQRLKSFSIFSTHETAGMPLMYSGAVSEKLSLTVERTPKNTSQFSGLTIWPGSIKGKVRVLQSADEINKMRDGEILVCPMTDPDYMPAIKKAKAIVTDQGGVLCHAAIVARELQKICVVGTQIATKILGDGDMVEVNANTGIVKKLKGGTFTTKRSA